MTRASWDTDFTSIQLEVDAVSMHRPSGDYGCTSDNAGYPKIDEHQKLFCHEYILPPAPISISILFQYDFLSVFRTDIRKSCFRQRRAVTFTI